ncbi:MAG: AAA family ATPase, partial [Gaiellaceae bacterium]
MERKLATALFADLVDSTGLGEQDPERTRVLLERFYDTLASEIELAGGTIEKFAGDAVMAVFGAPTAHEDHAERALHAALSLQRRVADVFGDTLQVRVGVNTGEMVVGEARHGSSFVTGDAVNVAARLEQAAPPGTVLAGERTVTLARGAFEFGPPTSIDAKGKAEPVPCRAVVRALTLMRPRGVSGLQLAFVGRETETELLRATYRRALELGTPHLVTIFGDAGVGKTRLVRELWAWLAEQDPEPRRRTGRCLAYGHVTYWALGEIVKEELGIRDSDSDDQIALRLGEHRGLGLALGHGAATEVSPVNAREDLQNAAVTFFDSLASDRPAVVLFEDLHWADDALLDLVERILRDARGPLLLVATSR